MLYTGVDSDRLLPELGPFLFPHQYAEKLLNVNDRAAFWATYVANNILISPTTIFTDQHKIEEGVFYQWNDAVSGIPIEYEFEFPGNDIREYRCNAIVSRAIYNEVLFLGGLTLLYLNPKQPNDYYGDFLTFEFDPRFEIPYRVVNQGFANTFEIVSRLEQIARSSLVKPHLNNIRPDLQSL